MKANDRGGKVFLLAIFLLLPAAPALAITDGYFAANGLIQRWSFDPV